MPIRSLHSLAAGLSLGLAGLLGGTIQATEPQSSLPQPVTLASMMILQETADESTASPTTALPASITAPSEILPLATGGSFIFEPLPTRGSCVLRPDVRCTGPDYCGCTPRIYYGTNPCDDDPVLTMSPTVCDHKTMHWYEKAFNMVLRKKAIAAALNH